ncbi:TPA: hypothetical protein HA265_05770 [Candidatus Woesearchaeota archaeon]|nr:hypothetical protein [Candidatus Woesearchaeota archaeon]
MKDSLNGNLKNSLERSVKGRSVKGGSVKGRLVKGGSVKGRLVKGARTKRAASAYISWILIMAFVVALSAFMYSFMTDYTKETTKDVKKQVYNTDECRTVSLNIISACISSQLLNITIQNTNYIRIDGLDFRIYDSGRVPVHTNQTNITMNPNRVKPLTLDTGTTSVGFVEVVPRIYKEDLEIICGDRKAQADVTPC